MSATGLEVFDRTLHITNTWLKEIMESLGPDRQVAWHALGAVLHAVRDRIPPELAVHFGAQLPLLVRGLYYDQWVLSREPTRERTADAFLAHVSDRLQDTRTVNVQEAVRAVFHVIDHHVTPEQVANVRHALPKDVQALWPRAGAARSAA